MASLKEIRARIGSVQSTHKITSAMKMVSAAKLHKAEDRTLQAVPYKNKLSEVLARYLGSIDDENFKVSLSVEREVKKIALVAISSSSGLCGAFNSNIAKLLKQKIEENLSLGREILIIPIGTKVEESLKAVKIQHPDIEINKEFVHLCEKPDYNESCKASKMLTEMFQNGEFDRVELIYNHYKNAGVQIPTVDQFLPIATMSAEGGDSNRLYFVEPNPKEFVESLVPIVIRTMFYTTLLDSSTAEFGARTTAMQAASENAEKLLSEITVQYNRARQESITNELIDIVSGSLAQK